MDFQFQEYKDLLIQQTKILQQLKHGLLTFFDELIDILPSEKYFLIMRFFIEQQVSIVDVMKYIHKNLVPVEQHVENKNDTYFKQHAIFFEKLRDYEDNFNYFKTLWEQTQDPENKEVVWLWLKHFIHLSKDYYSLSS